MSYFHNYWIFETELKVYLLMQQTYLWCITWELVLETIRVVIEGVFYNRKDSKIKTSKHLKPIQLTKPWLHLCCKWSTFLRRHFAMRYCINMETRPIRSHKRRLACSKLTQFIDEGSSVTLLLWDSTMNITIRRSKQITLHTNMSLCQLYISEIDVFQNITHHHC